MIPHYHFEDMLGLDVKKDALPIINCHKISFVGFVKYYKAPIKLTASSMFARRIKTISNGIKKMLANIEGKFDIIDAQIIYRPGFGCYGGKSSLAAKVAIRFLKEEDWIDFQFKHKDNFYRSDL